MASTKELVFERFFNVPRSSVWQCWTDPLMVREWWVPEDVNILECEVNPQVGGKIHIVTKNEKKGDFKGKRSYVEGVFKTVEHDSKLLFTVKIWTEGEEQTNITDQMVEAIFTVENGKAKLQLKAMIAAAEDFATESAQTKEVRRYYRQRLGNLENLMAKYESMIKEVLFKKLHQKRLDNDSQEPVRK